MKKVISIFLCFAIMLGCGCSSNFVFVCSADQAEIINGDFEEGTSGWTPMWSGKPLTIKDTPDSYAISGKTLCIPDYAGAYQILSVEKNSTYTISADMRTTGANTTFLRVFAGNMTTPQNAEKPSSPMPIVQTVITKETWNVSVEKAEVSFDTGDNTEITVWFVNNTGNIACVDNVVIEKDVVGEVKNGDFSNGTEGWSCDRGTLTIIDIPESYAISGKTLNIPHGTTAMQTVTVEKNKLYSFYCDLRTTGNSHTYFRVYAGTEISASALIAEDYITTLTWNNFITSSSGDFYTGDANKVTICIYNNCSNIVLVDNVSISPSSTKIYSSIHNGDFELGTEGWSESGGTLSAITTSYSIDGNTLCIPHGATAKQMVRVEKESRYSYSFNARTTGNHKFYFRIYGGISMTEATLIEECYVTDLTWDVSVLSISGDFATGDYDIITVCMYNVCENIATVDNINLKYEGEDTANKAYLLDFKNNNTTTNLYPVEFFCSNNNVNGKAVSFSFDYYMPDDIKSAIVQDCSHGAKYPDSQSGTNNLKKGQHTYSYSNDSYYSASGVFAPGIQMGSADYGIVYVWNISVKINGNEVPLSFGGSLDVSKIELSKVPFEQFYLITSSEKAVVTPNIESVTLGDSESASFSFDYYLSSGKATVGDDVLEAGVSSYSTTVSGKETGGKYLPAITLEGESLIYIWNIKLTKNTTAVDIFMLATDKGNIERISFEEIPLPEAPKVLSAQNNTVTLEETNGYEYSIDGKTWQYSNVFENLETNKAYTFYQRKTSDKARLGFVKLAFPSAPVVELEGESKLIVKPIEGFEYSVDLEKWYKTNEFTRLEADTEYEIYQRLSVEDSVYEIVSEPTSANTCGNDVLEGSDADKLVFVRKQLVGNGKNLSADVNEDGEFDIRDLVRLKKNTLSEPQYLISCFGDSITEGMGMAAGKSYPSQLNAMLGDKFKVYNGGASGENSFSIAARQGAYDLYTLNDITFGAKSTRATIGNFSNNGIVSADGRPLRVTRILGTPMSINPLNIMGENFMVSLDNFKWNTATTPITYSFTLFRGGSTDNELVIPKGTKVELASAEIATKSYCDIYYIGANGGYDGDTEILIDQYKAMIKHHGNRRYLIITPHWTDKFDEVFEKEFGGHAVNLRKAAIEYGLEYEGLTPTADDTSLIKAGNVPASLCYQNNYNIHLNEYGYHFLAHLLYERGSELKFW